VVGSDPPLGNSGLTHISFSPVSKIVAVGGETDDVNLIQTASSFIIIRDYVAVTDIYKRGFGNNFTKMHAL